jgi:hypothetical protein
VKAVFNRVKTAIDRIAKWVIMLQHYNKQFSML